MKVILSQENILKTEIFFLNRLVYLYCFFFEWSELYAFPKTGFLLYVLLVLMNIPPKKNNEHFQDTQFR